MKIALQDIKFARKNKLSVPHTDTNINPFFLAPATLLSPRVTASRVLIIAVITEYFLPGRRPHLAVTMIIIGHNTRVSSDGVLYCYDFSGAPVLRFFSGPRFNMDHARIMVTNVNARPLYVLTSFHAQRGRTRDRQERPRP